MRHTMLPTTHPISLSTSSIYGSRFGKAILLAMLAIVVCSVIGGCTSYSAVTTEDASGTYHLTANGWSYSMSMTTLTASSHDKASAWCAAQGKDMQLRQQVRSWQPMQIELSFRCVPPQENDSKNPWNKPGH